MDSSDIYINDSTNLPNANHSRCLPLVPNAIPHKIPSHEEAYETVKESELEASQKRESGKFSRS